MFHQIQRQSRMDFIKYLILIKTNQYFLLNLPMCYTVQNYELMIYVKDLYLIILIIKLFAMSNSQMFRLCRYNM